MLYMIGVIHDCVILTSPLKAFMPTVAALKIKEPVGFYLFFYHNEYSFFSFQRSILFRHSQRLLGNDMAKQLYQGSDASKRVRGREGRSLKVIEIQPFTHMHKCQIYPHDDFEIFY
jgi:hypothetical protein